jgi:hypothetical protein
MLAALSLVTLAAEPPPPPLPGVMVEAEFFQPQGEGWRVVMNGQGNYMVDIIGFQHISGERLLSADARAADARATATVTIPEAGDYRLWARFETPTGTEERFRVEVRQGGRLVGSGELGAKDAPKFWFNSKEPMGQYDASWGSEGLADQWFDVAGLAAGPAELTLIATVQPEPVANRNVDFLWLTRDLTDSWRTRKGVANLYPILDAALADLPPRYYLRLTAPEEGVYQVGYVYNRLPWYGQETPVKLTANTPSAWLPLTRQDTTHFTTLKIARQKAAGLAVKVELAGSPDGTPLYRALDWNDPQAAVLHVGLPPYPGRYAGEQVMTIAEQYQQVLDYLRQHPSTGGRDPVAPINWGGSLPAFKRGLEADQAAALHHALGMRLFVGFQQPPKIDAEAIAVARERFQQWGLQPNRSIALGKYRQMPTAQNVAQAAQAARDAGVLDLVHRFDYGDEIAFSEWLSLIPKEELPQRFAAWQQRHLGATPHATPDSSAKAAQENPALYVDSLAFYEDEAIAEVARLAQEIPKQLGPEVRFGANVGCHPFYYPEIAKYIKWFRHGAADFGRHSEYFWQIGQPGPLINAYIADHFRSGMQDNPKAVLLQYTMPHSPGNSDASFRRTAFSHLAHGARGLDYFGIGINYTFTENYVDFRDGERFAAMRDINRATALIEDLLPTSRVAPSRVAMILSDSTERWDFAGIALDRANAAVFGPDYRTTRLCFHLDRVGIYYALVQGSRSPDLLIEEDVVAGQLANRDVAYWVGDCAPPAVVAALTTWVEGGGHLVVTAGGLRYDSSRRPLPAGNALLGLAKAELEAKQTFFRPQIELPRLAPLDHIGELPVLGLRDRLTPGAEARVVATFADGSPAVVERTLGKGKVTTIGALPGVAILWAAYQPPPVPSRGVLSHQPLPRCLPAAAKLILDPAAAVVPQLDAGADWLDARLIAGPQGRAIPVANYNADVTTPVTLTLRGLAGVTGITSAVAGPLKLEPGEGGAVRITWTPGYGDILRLLP